ncbi:MAG: M23 family metallopeptidase [Ruminococcaceae bacterium]|nr:M23 family metallopeptidase [Oscillospiraceae bacterium]
MKSEKYFGRRKDTVKKRSKQILTAALVVTAVFLPAILAGLHYSISSKKPTEKVDEKMYVTLSSEGVVLYEESEDPIIALTGSLVSTVNSILTDSVKVTSVPRDITDRAPLTLSVKHLENTSEYTLFFSLGASKNYYRDSSGNYHAVSDSASAAFFASKYAQGFYQSAIPPILTTTAGDEVIPATVQWKYRNDSSKLIDAEGIKTESEEITYDMSGNLGLSFEIPPDDCSVEVYKSGIILYDVNHKNLATTAVEPGTTLQFKVKAVWNETDTASFCGTITYNFKVLVRNQSEFLLDREEYSTGSLAVVSCTNIIELDRISFSSTPDIDVEPEFFRVGDMVYALIPLERTLDGGDYTFTFSYGATEQDIPLKIKKTEGVSLNVTGDTEDTLSDLLDTVSSGKYPFPTIGIEDSHEGKVYCQSTFISPLGNTEPLYGFGTHFEGIESGVSHTSLGAFYKLSDTSSAPVTAINSGIVAEIGESEYLGKYIIIDHGMGLRSCYAHLGAVNLSLGEIVAVGQSVGRTGVTEYTKTEGLFLVCTVFDVPIDPAELIGRDLIGAQNNQKDN